MVQSCLSRRMEICLPLSENRQRKKNFANRAANITGFESISPRADPSIPLYIESTRRNHLCRLSLYQRWALSNEVLVSFSSKQKDQFAHQLGAFLTALHTYPVEKAFPFTREAREIKKRGWHFTRRLRKKPTIYGGTACHLDRGYLSPLFRRL
jgi:hypothetical protein